MTDRLWGGRFTRDITREVLDYTATVDIDRRLFSHDVWQNLAHAAMLVRTNIIPPAAGGRILDALLDLHERVGRGEVTLRIEHEDVHLNIEHMVRAHAGTEAGGHLHTARSRNDQVATVTRMYLREVALDAMSANLDAVAALLDLTERDYVAIIPGYTHNQVAQPVTVAFWSSAHASMLLRDAGRFEDAYRRINESPLGGCALAGTSFPIDRDLTARLLGFDRILAHALDATSARDHVIELAACIAIGASSLSRMAEEIVIWTGYEYRLCQVGDEFATGSSIMPQKKNPVVAELVRGRAGRASGTLTQLLSAVKGVALGYSYDLQEDKPLLWNSIDTYLASLRLVAGQARSMQFNAERGEELCWENFSTATELANHLVVERGVPFRDAHHVTGRLVRTLLERGTTLRDTATVRAVLATLGHELDPDVLADVVSPLKAVTSYRSQGGTSPDSVRAMVVELLRGVERTRQWVEDTRRRLDGALTETLEVARVLVRERISRKPGRE
jgi:argininosuccinate lyase